MPISCGDLEELTFFAQRVEELCLTDTTHDQDLEVSADTITRLAIALRGTDNPLFPRLKRLRLEGADSQLSFLWFCVTPSLETRKLHCYWAKGERPSSITASEARTKIWKETHQQQATHSPDRIPWFWRLLEGNPRCGPYWLHWGSPADSLA